MALRIESRWLQMRDGARIAIDLLLPTAFPAEASLGSVLIPAREWRSIGGGARTATAWSVGRQRVPRGPESALVEAFVGKGLAVVAFDVRGTGASDGSWRRPWSEDEIADGAEVVAWMLRQPWSNGRIATAGSRYGATAALLIAGAHPGVRAVAGLAIDADLYADVAFPGGLRNGAALDRWSHRLAALDANRPPGWPSLLGPLAPWLGRGVRSVNEAQGRAELRRIVRARHNARFGALLRGVEARDDPIADADAGDEPVPVDRVGMGVTAESVAGALAASGAVVGLWAGWPDGASAAASLRLWSTLPAVREVTIGAGDSRAGPAPAQMATFVAAALTAPETAAVAADDAAAEVGWDEVPDARWIRYQTIGLAERAERSTSSWPPAGVEPHELFVAPDARLRWEQGHDVGSLEVVLDGRATTGRRNRWHARLGTADPGLERPAPSARGRTIWTSEPLAEPVTITGQPVVVLAVRVPAEDVTLFASLDLITPRGEGRALSDGQLRAIHRARPPAEPTFLRSAMQPLVPGERTELRIPLAPTSVRIETGWRLRLSLAGADRDTFRVPPGQPRSITLEYGGPASSRLLLPIVEA